MAVPTRRIETDEFKKLINQEEGESIDRYILGAFSFIPPRPNETYNPKTNDLVNILLLNSIEPLIYRDPSNGITFIILPTYQDDQFDYQYMRDIHPNKKAWGYYLAHYGWRADDEDHELDEDWIWYDDTPVPAFELGKVATH